MDVRVSTIIPTCGTRPGLLREALRSVRRQHRRPDEVVLVVDGAEDRMREQIASELDGISPLHILTTGATDSERRGVSAARNVGARAATGRWLAFLDDDDLWLPNHLSHWAEHGSQADVYLPAFLKLRRDRTLEPEKWPPAILHPRAFHALNPGLRGSNLVIRAETYWHARGFDEKLPVFNDMDFGARLSSLPAVRYVRQRQPTVVFRSHDSPRLTTRGSDAMRLGLARFWDRHRDRMTDVERERFWHIATTLWGVRLEEAA